MRRTSTTSNGRITRKSLESRTLKTTLSPDSAAPANTLPGQLVGKRALPLGAVLAPEVKRSFGRSESAAPSRAASIDHRRVRQNVNLILVLSRAQLPHLCQHPFSLRLPGLSDLDV